MNEFFEVIEQIEKDYLSIDDFIFSQDNSQLEEFTDTLQGYLDNMSNQINYTDNNYSFIANSQLSGDVSPCAGLSCRMDNVEQIARNAALYADTVFIQNPFDKYLGTNDFKEFDRENIINDLIILKFLKPLIDEKIVRFSSMGYHFCPDCYSKFVESYLGSDYNKKKESQKQFLLDSFLKNSKIGLSLVNDELSASINSSNDLLHHPRTIYFYGEIPDVIKKMKPTNSLKILTDKQVRDTQILDFVIEEILQDIQIQEFYSRKYGAHYITNRPIDFELLSIVNNETVQIQSKNVTKNISHEIPFIKNVPIKNLIELRKKEGEAFQVYRNTIKNLTSDISEFATDKQIYFDIIKPELDKIDLTIKNSKKVIWQETYSDFLIHSGFVAVGLTTGLLIPNIGQITATIGGLNFFNKVGKNIQKMISESENLRNENFYFLWKVKEKAKRIK